MTKQKPLKIAIASGKGGTGKTMLSANLAAYLAQTQETLLVDLDVEEPNDLLFFKGEIRDVTNQYKMIPQWDESKCTLCGICSSTCKYHAVIQLGSIILVFKELCHSCYACSELCPVHALPMIKHKMGETKNFVSGNLTCIESRLNIGEEQAVPLIHKTHDLVEQSFNNFPVQIFDCPPGTSCPVVAATKKADYVVLVTEPTPFGLNDLRLAVETIREIQKPLGVVINRYGIGNNEVEKYCREQRIPILAKIPYDRKIAELYSSGQLVYDQVEGISASLDTIIKTIRDAV